MLLAAYRFRARTRSRLACLQGSPGRGSLARGLRQLGLVIALPHLGQYCAPLDVIAFMDVAHPAVYALDLENIGEIAP